MMDQVLLLKQQNLFVKQLLSVVYAEGVGTTGTNLENNNITNSKLSFIGNLLEFWVLEQFFDSRKPHLSSSFD